MKKKILLCLGIGAIGVIISILLPACKSCNKKEQNTAAKTDSTSAIVTPQPQNPVTLPHADSALIPVLSKILDEAFELSAKKDYGRFATLIVYRGPDSSRYGNDVFNTKNNYEKNVIRITSDVFNKWNRGVESRSYSRVFEMDQPDDRKLEVLEVIFISKKNVDRKFFGFLKFKDDYKIADVTAYL